MVYVSLASLVAQRIKRLPAMQETQVQSLGWEDPLEKEMATHSSILAWRILWTEEPERATVHGVAKSRTRLSDFTSLHFTSLMWASFCIKYFTTITLVNLHNKSLQSVLFSPLPSTLLINGKTEVQRSVRPPRPPS